jgi:hypothetical protein
MEERKPKTLFQLEDLITSLSQKILSHDKKISMITKAISIPHYEHLASRHSELSALYQRTLNRLTISTELVHCSRKLNEQDAKTILEYAINYADKSDEVVEKHSKMPIASIISVALAEAQKQDLKK